VITPRLRSCAREVQPRGRIERGRLRTAPPRASRIRAAHARARAVVVRPAHTRMRLAFPTARAVARHGGGVDVQQLRQNRRWQIGHSSAPHESARCAAKRDDSRGSNPDACPFAVARRTRTPHADVAAHWGAAFLLHDRVTCGGGAESTSKCVTNPCRVACRSRVGRLLNGAPSTAVQQPPRSLLADGVPPRRAPRRIDRCLCARCSCRCRCRSTYRPPTSRGARTVTDLVAQDDTRSRQRCRRTSPVLGAPRRATGVPRPVAVAVRPRRGRQGGGGVRSSRPEVGRPPRAFRNAQPANEFRDLECDSRFQA
jgi:hypothetical protein